MLCHTFAIIMDLISIKIVDSKQKYSASICPVVVTC
uniref:Uncharacterized protein n=1 Tax=Arundo donax TaxID=35708 RepID=A0A0A9BXA9_ARUDO